MERGSVGTALIGPNALLRQALAHILESADFQVLASAPHIDGSIAASLPQDHALLIIEASSDIDATVHQIETFKVHRPTGRVVVLAHQLELPEMVLAFTAGANAYLVSVSACDVFIKSLELVMLGETILPPLLLSLLYNNENAPGDGNGKLDDNGTGKPGQDADIADDRADDRADGGNDDDTDDDVEAARETLRNVDNNKAPHLSARQRLILRCLIEGDPNKIIARKINITEATVKVHIKAILRKIRVQNRTQAAIWAMTNRSFTPTKNNQSSGASKLSVRPSGQVSLPVGEHPLPLSPEFKIGRAHGDGWANDDRLIGKDMERKYD
jgi:two-component system nitrate/nitrite response regulator NarL